MLRDQPSLSVAPRDTGFAARALAVAVLGQVALTGVALDADHERAYLFGHPLPVLCWMRETFGLPCPTCGLTRAVGLSLHASFGEAWRLFPAAPLTLAWLTGLALLVLLPRTLRGAGIRASWPRIPLRHAALGCAAVSAAVWLADYALRLVAAVRGAS